MFENLNALNQYMVPGSTKVKFILGVSVDLQFVPIVSKEKLDDIYNKLSNNTNFKSYRVDKKISNDIVLTDDLKKYQETEIILYDTLCLIPGWTHSFRAVAYNDEKISTRKQFNDTTAVLYHCDRFEYKDIWTYNLITLTRNDKASVYIFELVFSGDLLVHPKAPHYYINSAVAKLLDFNEQL